MSHIIIIVKLRERKGHCHVTTKLLKPITMPGLCVQPLDFLLLLHSILPDEVHHLAIPILGHGAVRHEEDLVNVIFLNPLKDRVKCCKDSLRL